MNSHDLYVLEKAADSLRAAHNAFVRNDAIDWSEIERDATACEQLVAMLRTAANPWRVVMVDSLSQDAPRYELWRIKKRVALFYSGADAYTVMGLLNAQR